MFFTDDTHSFLTSRLQELRPEITYIIKELIETDGTYLEEIKQALLKKHKLKVSHVKVGNILHTLYYSGYTDVKSIGSCKVHMVNENGKKLYEDLERMKL